MSTSQLFNKIDSGLREKVSGLASYTRCKYLKESIDYLGVSTPDVRKLIIEIIDSAKPSADDFRELVTELFIPPIGEHKLAAILIMEKYFSQIFSDTEIVEICGTVYEKKNIFDWSTSDWLCVRILTPLIDRADQHALNSLIAWKDSDYLWKSRASLVSFAQAKSLKDHIAVVLDISAILIRSEERFSKTAVAWVMRELTEIDKDLVLDFLRRNSPFLSGEMITNTIKNLDKKEQKDIKKELKKLLKENS